MEWSTRARAQKQIESERWRQGRERESIRLPARRKNRALQLRSHVAFLPRPLHLWRTLRLNPSLLHSPESISRLRLRLPYRLLQPSRRAQTVRSSPFPSPQPNSDRCIQAPADPSSEPERPTAVRGRKTARRRPKRRTSERELVGDTEFLNNPERRKEDENTPEAMKTERGIFEQTGS